MKIRTIVLICIFLSLLLPARSGAYLPQDTHPLINEQAIRQSGVDSYFKNSLNFAKGIEEVVDSREIFKWVRQGGKDEDANIRGVFHFHDPTKAWNNAGIWGIAFSSLDWAQDHTIGPVPTCSDLDKMGMSCPPLPSSSNAEWSWPGARKYYYEALTAGDATVRTETFGKTFLTLGHVMHLLADAAVPEHTRNDQHMMFPFGSRYERWSEINQGALKAFIASNVNPLLYSTITNISNVPGYIPISNFWDTTPNPGYGGTLLGLAEYTNYNFLSPNTIFKDYTYPINPAATSGALKIVVSEDGKNDKRVYFSDVTSDSKPIEHLVSTGYLWADLNAISPFSMDVVKFNLDENCFQDYASILVPKAVSYSAGLLNYFFRGEIEITLPENGVYAMAGPGEAFDRIHLKVRNITQTGEEMTNGIIQVVVKYKLAQADPFQADLIEPVPTNEEFSYVTSAANTGPIPKDNPVELVFDLTQNPIPLWATNVYLQVVYRGQLGNEQDAVAVGYKDISEPTQIDLINEMDHICINGSYLMAGSDEAIQAVDLNGDGQADRDAYAHGLKDIYLAFSSAPTSTQTPEYASPTNYTAYFAGMPPGSYGRLHILTDYKFAFSAHSTIQKVDSRDTWSEYGFLDKLYTVNAMKNQTEHEIVRTYEVGNITITEWQDVVIGALLANERGISVWWGIFHQNGSDTTCTTSDADPDLTGPVAIEIPR